MKRDPSTELTQAQRNLLTLHGLRWRRVATEFYAPRSWLVWRRRSRSSPPWDTRELLFDVERADTIEYLTELIREYAT